MSESLNLLAASVWTPEHTSARDFTTVHKFKLEGNRKRFLRIQAHDGVLLVHYRRMAAGETEVETPHSGSLRVTGDQTFQLPTRTDVGVAVVAATGTVHGSILLGD